ncbi:hypothetical protein JOC85_001609 [Bacillus mesophilus]|uniref:Nucleotidyltransferase family protein n=1 Tax=Bacillus mesophilus TaxID=1808955 RepID=A0A6M0Q5G2_9BACI|nr:hypothetical protein [Bacillus mesophilus]MBM7660837.1 hypothetical protein [Bacillus mesophilus]NEY71616.1 hypothetical protein [Bacillus mesophilus]
MLKTLSQIGEKLSDKGITWGVGGSLLLNFYNIIDQPNDIDILVDEEDAAELNKIMLSLGHPKEAVTSYPFCTVNFSKYRLNDIDLDVMAGFSIQHAEGIYKITLKGKSIVGYKRIKGVSIPLCSLEDWYILYWLIPDKQEKALHIEKYFKTNGVKYPQLLEEALKQNLPMEVKNRVKSLL